MFYYHFAAPIIVDAGNLCHIYYMEQIRDLYFASLLSLSQSKCKKTGSPIIMK